MRDRLYDNPKFLQLEELMDVRRLFKVEVIKDSSAHTIHGWKRLTTMQLSYPRFIHAELMTHRVFSRNAGSSRARPVSYTIRQTRSDPTFFVSLGLNKSGMQASEVADESVQWKFGKEWQELRDIVAEYAERWGAKTEDGGYGIHKQVANRVLEPFSKIDVLVTSQDWSSFFYLRCDSQTQPEMHMLADMMLEAYQNSVPGVIGGRGDYGWHLPYLSVDEQKNLPIEVKVACSVARCARVSYKPYDMDTSDVPKDIALYRRFLKSTPLHASPFEHVATPKRWYEYGRRWCRSNFDDFVQVRKAVESGESLFNNI